ncbi:MAG: DUF922 domain-containing protein [Candidatus Methylophosphatis roskildensis]
MADDRKPGPLGFTPASANSSGFDSGGPVTGGFTSAGPLGFDVEADPLADRLITRVDRDWVPTPKPKNDPIKVTAANLADLAKALSQLPEAGEGGGRLRADAVAAGTSAEASVSLHGNLINRVVEWIGYSSASPAAQAHWDQVLANLKRHEQRHMEIAIEEGDALATLLVGHKVGSTPSVTDKVSTANDKMAARQKELDDDSDHGKRKGHPYGDCNIDTTIK